jgi:hypothetical protein
MNKAAVIVGVNKCGGLPVLRGAVWGAHRLADWAEQQGFEVTLLTDSNDNPVAVSSIFNAVDRLVDRRNVSRLLIYFAGHGVLLAPGSEYWLLSSANRNPNEAVNLTGSIEGARTSGIRHVIFISDACRSKAAESWQLALKGSVIFPTNDLRIPRPAVDRLYASLPGDPALEVELKTASKAYDGIFTDCLLECLKSPVESLVPE